MIHTIEALLWIILGAVLGGLIQAVINWYAAFRESQGIALALAAEVRALHDLATFRQYLDLSDQIVGRLNEVGHVVNIGDIFAISITQDYFSVFNSVSSKIGLLGANSGEVVAVYTFIKALFEDFAQLQIRRDDFLDPARLLNVGNPIDQQHLPAVNEAVRIILLELTQNIRTLIGRLMTNPIIDTLETYSRKRWMRHIFE